MSSELSEKQQKQINNSDQPQQQDPDLHDLPEQQPERPSICSPKIIILTLLSSVFVFRNLYNYIMNPKNPQPVKVEVDTWANFWMAWERLSGYAIITVVFFILFVILKRKNMEYDEKALKQVIPEDYRAKNKREMAAAQRNQRQMNHNGQNQDINMSKQQ